MTDRDPRSGETDWEPRVAELMRTEVPTIAPDESVAAVARRIVESGLPGLPVVEAGKIVGIVTEADLLVRYADVSPPGVAAFFDWIVTVDAGHHFEEELRRVAAVTARDLMTHPVYSVRASATLGQIATLMVERRVNPVPVVDDAGALIGIVARADLLRLIARLEAGDVAGDATGPPAGPDDATT